MNGKEKLIKLLDSLIYRMEISDPTIVWFSERLEWLVDKLLSHGVIMPGSAEWVPLGDSNGWKHGHKFTHYCSKCGEYGFDSFQRCPRCAADMGRIIEPPEKVREMEL